MELPDLQSHEVQALLFALATPDAARYGKRRPIPLSAAALLEGRGLAVLSGDQDRMLTLTDAGLTVAQVIAARRASARIRVLAMARLEEITVARRKCSAMLSKVGKPKVTYETQAVAQLAQALSRICHPNDGFKVIECGRHWHLRTRRLEPFEKKRFRRELKESRRRKLERQVARYCCLFPYAGPPKWSAGR